jgi:threonine 3-dehydrogenase
MKALVKVERKPGLWLQDVPEPEMGINDVLIEVLRTGICGTDLHIYKWDEWAQRTIPVPMHIGHEFVGRILKTGANVNDFHEGEIVSGEGHVFADAAGTAWRDAATSARTPRASA